MQRQHAQQCQRKVRYFEKTDTYWILVGSFSSCMYKVVASHPNSDEKDQLFCRTGKVEGLQRPKDIGTLGQRDHILRVSLSQKDGLDSQQRQNLATVRSGRGVV